jgi:hypothetical protein
MKKFKEFLTVRTVQIYNLVKPNITKCFVIYPGRWEHTLFPDFT